MKILPISDARAQLSSLVNDVDRDFERITLTKSGRAMAVLMSSDEFDAWQETLEIMADASALKALESANRDIAAGHIVSHTEAMRELESA